MIGLGIGLWDRVKIKASDRVRNRDKLHLWLWWIQTVITNPWVLRLLAMADPNPSCTNQWTFKRSHIRQRLITDKLISSSPLSARLFNTPSADLTWLELEKYFSVWPVDVGATNGATLYIGPVDSLRLWVEVDGHRVLRFTGGRQLKHRRAV